MTQYNISVDLKGARPKSEVREVVLKALNKYEPNPPVAVHVTKVSVSDVPENGYPKIVGEVSFSSTLHMDRIAQKQKILKPVVTHDNGESFLTGFELVDADVWPLT